MRLFGYLLVLTMTMTATLGADTPWAGSQQDTIAADEVAALAQFEVAIASYLALRHRLRNELAGPVPNSTALELTRASDSLAAAIRRARAGAREGHIFRLPISVVVKRRVDDVVRLESLGPTLEDIDDEAPTLKTPSVHLRFPSASQMATMPPSLLAALPALPKELEYRIVGSYLVLRDVDAALILDYIPAAVPRKQ